MMFLLCFFVWLLFCLVFLTCNVLFCLNGLALLVLVLCVLLCVCFVCIRLFVCVCSGCVFFVRGVFVVFLLCVLGFV